MDSLGNGSNLVYVAGNIAAGKTTTSTRLCAALHARLVPEQADDNPFLAKFYADMARWTFHTDVHFLAARAEAVLREHHPGGAPVVFDRSYSEGAVFAEVAHRAGLADDDEWQTFSSLLTTLEQLLPAPAVVVYLTADPQVLFDRVRQRGRRFEQGITPDYLKALQTAYDAWIDRQPNVIVVDTGTVDLRTDDATLEDLTSKVIAALSRQD